MEELNLPKCLRACRTDGVVCDVLCMSLFNKDVNIYRQNNPMIEGGGNWWVRCSDGAKVLGGGDANSLKDTLCAFYDVHMPELVTCTAEQANLPPSASALSHRGQKPHFCRIELILLLQSIRASHKLSKLTDADEATYAALLVTCEADILKAYEHLEVVTKTPKRQSRSTAQYPGTGRSRSLSAGGTRRSSSSKQKDSVHVVEGHEIVPPPPLLDALPAFDAQRAAHAGALPHPDDTQASVDVADTNFRLIRSSDADQRKVRQQITRKKRKRSMHDDNDSRYSIVRHDILCEELGRGKCPTSNCSKMTSVVDMMPVGFTGRVQVSCKSGHVRVVHLDQHVPRDANDLSTASQPRTSNLYVANLALRVGTTAFSPYPAAVLRALWSIFPHVSDDALHLSGEHATRFDAIVADLDRSNTDTEIDFLVRRLLSDNDENLVTLAICGDAQFSRPQRNRQGASGAKQRHAPNLCFNVLNADRGTVVLCEPITLEAAKESDEARQSGYSGGEPIAMMRALGRLVQLLRERSNGAIDWSTPEGQSKWKGRMYFCADTSSFGKNIACNVLGDVVLVRRDAWHAVKLMKSRFVKIMTKKYKFEKMDSMSKKPEKIAQRGLMHALYDFAVARFHDACAATTQDDVKNKWFQSPVAITFEHEYLKQPFIEFQEGVFSTLLPTCADVNSTSLLESYHNFVTASLAKRLHQPRQYDNKNRLARLMWNEIRDDSNYGGFLKEIFTRMNCL